MISLLDVQSDDGVSVIEGAVGPLMFISARATTGQLRIDFGIDRWAARQHRGKIADPDKGWRHRVTKGE